MLLCRVDMSRPSDTDARVAARPTQLYINVKDTTRFPWTIRVDNIRIIQRLAKKSWCRPWRDARSTATKEGIYRPTSSKHNICRYNIIAGENIAPTPNDRQFHTADSSH